MILIVHFRHGHLEYNVGECRRWSADGARTCCRIKWHLIPLYHDLLPGGHSLLHAGRDIRRRWWKFDCSAYNHLDPPWSVVFFFYGGINWHHYLHCSWLLRAESRCILNKFNWASISSITHERLTLSQLCDSRALRWRLPCASCSWSAEKPGQRASKEVPVVNI
jgi:hypothetical protein